MTKSKKAEHLKVGCCPQEKSKIVHMDTVSEDGLLCGNEGLYITATLNWNEVTCKNCLRYKPPKRRRKNESSK